MQVLIQCVVLLVGFAALVKGADLFVDGVSGIAERFGIPQLVIGLTIVAMGTSAPEAAVSVTAALKGNADITVGNIVGSNILNILIILGITAVIVDVAVAKSTLCYELPYMLVVTVVLIVMGITGAKIDFVEGIMLWCLFILYLIYLYRMAKNGKEEPIQHEQQSVIKLLFFSVIGGVFIIAGSSFTVESASYIARFLGISERFIGLTVVALGTSLPELVTSVAAARKGKADIAIGNIVGSNIFNILFVIGTASLITPVLYEPKFVIDGIIAVLAGVLLWIGICKTRILKRVWGIIMLLAYVVYFCYLLYQ